MKSCSAAALVCGLIHKQFVRSLVPTVGRGPVSHNLDKWNLCSLGESWASYDVADRDPNHQPMYDYTKIVRTRQMVGGLAQRPRTASNADKIVPL